MCIDKVVDHEKSSQHLNSLKIELAEDGMKSSTVSQRSKAQRIAKDAMKVLYFLIAHNLVCLTFFFNNSTQSSNNTVVIQFSIL